MPRRDGRLFSSVSRRFSRIELAITANDLAHVARGRVFVNLSAATGARCAKATIGSDHRRGKHHEADDCQNEDGVHTDFLKSARIEWRLAELTELVNVFHRARTIARYELWRADCQFGDRGENVLHALRLVVNFQSASFPLSFSGDPQPNK